MIRDVIVGGGAAVALLFVLAVLLESLLSAVFGTSDRTRFADVDLLVKDRRRDEVNR